MKLPRTMRIVALVAFLSLSLAAGSGAQQLWSVKEVVTQPPLPVVPESMAVNTAAATTGAPAAEVAIVEVAYDYLRVGMGYLELPLRDGSVIEAENAVFEDRGAGNLMWSGEIPGTGYENVLFTVQDGHLVGWFGKPGGPNYVIHAGPDGRGSLAVEPNLTGDWCGTDHHAQHAVPGLSVAVQPQSSGRTGDRVAPVNRPGAAISAANESHRLDILTLYPRDMELIWNATGGVSVGIRRLSDYLNMALRNNGLPVEANLIPKRWDSGVRPAYIQGGHYFTQRLSWRWNSLYQYSREVSFLRERHEADLIHFITPYGTSNAAGQANGAGHVKTDQLPEVPIIYSGWSTPSPSVFAHEIGHNLGAAHNPETIPNFPEWQQKLRWPYIHGYTDEPGLAGCIKTIMSYGGCVEVPFYSSVMRRSSGRTIGTAGVSEVERLFRERVPVISAAGENQPRLNPALKIPRFSSIEWKAPDTLLIESSLVHDTEEMHTRIADLSIIDIDGRAHVDVELDPLAGDLQGENVRFLDGGGVATARAEDVRRMEISGLQPDGRYRIVANVLFYAVSEGVWEHGWFAMGESPTPRVGGSLAAPAGVSAEVTGPDGVRLRWREDRSIEAADNYSIYWRKFSDEEEEQSWKRHGELLPASTRHALVDGLVAEDRRATRHSTRSTGTQMSAIGRYSFVVVAHKGSAFRASSVFDFEFRPGPHPQPTASGDYSDCWARPSGVVLRTWRVHVCVETPDGARRRAWDYGLESAQAGLLWFFERDKTEILVKVIDGCAVNDHWWVFVGPVTTLPFHLVVGRSQANFGTSSPYLRPSWTYDSRGGTARTVSDTMAFSCTASEVAAAKRASEDSGKGRVAASLRRGAVNAGAPFAAAGGSGSSAPPAMGAHTDCEPVANALELLDGYTVSMCYETYVGAIGNAYDFGLDSSQSGLLYFFERDNVEVLIKVLDGCGVNGHRWVFVAPVTDLAFNLHVTSPEGEVWRHMNRLGQTADAVSDTAAFPCSTA